LHCIALLGPTPISKSKEQKVEDKKLEATMTFEQALAGKHVPSHIRRALILIELEHLGFDGALHHGQMVVHQALAEEVREIFADIKAARFPIEKIVPVVRYDWSDDLSMVDNNSSCFNYRNIVGQQRLSQHARGRAIDINPLQNPYVKPGVKGTLILPPGAVYDPQQMGAIVEPGAVVEAFKRRGWNWGGDWHHLKDWQHFEKAE
jgi:hypothetical protein